MLRNLSIEVITLKAVSAIYQSICLKFTSCANVNSMYFFLFVNSYRDLQSGIPETDPGLAR